MIQNFCFRTESIDNIKRNMHKIFNPQTMRCEKWTISTKNQ